MVADKTKFKIYFIRVQQESHIKMDLLPMVLLPADIF